MNQDAAALKFHVPPFLRWLTVCDLKVFPDSFIEVNLNLKELIAKNKVLYRQLRIATEISKYCFR